MSKPISDAEKRRRLDLSARNFKHGLSDSPTYVCWRAMITRCYRPKQSVYDRYGARGITVCEEWKTFSGFLKDMGVRPSKQFSIDRIDNSLGYCPGNCRWATSKEQAQNTSSTIWLELGDKRMCISDWSKELNVGVTTLIWRFRRGWPASKILSSQKYFKLKRRVKCKTNKINWEIAQEIRRLRSLGLPRLEVAGRFGIKSVEHISDICAYRRWPVNPERAL